jgi:RHS repeat-associated protein
VTVGVVVLAVLAAGLPAAPADAASGAASALGTVSTRNKVPKGHPPAKGRAIQHAQRIPPTAPGVVPTAPSPIIDFGPSPSTASAVSARGPAHGSAKVPAGFDPVKSKELVNQRGPNTTVFSDPDGSFTTQISSRPVHFKDSSGNWVNYDTTLAAQPGGRWKNRAGDTQVDVAAKADDPALARVDWGGGHSAGFALTGATGAGAVVAGATATFPGALPGVDVELSSMWNGVKETLVLASPATPTRYVFPLDLNGLQPSLVKDGSVNLTDPTSGVTVGTIPHGFMEDSSISAAAHTGAISNAVSYALQSAGGQTDLVVTLDQRWLSDPARVWPVRVDPTLTQFGNNIANMATYMDSAGGNFAQSTELRVGLDPTTNATDGTFIEFGQLGQVLAPGDQIFSAQLDLYETKSGPQPAGSCDARGAGIYEVTTPWSSASGGLNTVSYAAGLKDWASYAVGGGNNTTCPAGWVSYSANPSNLLNWVKDWADGHAPNYGLTVRVDPGSERDPVAFKDFASFNATANTPYLQVSWAPYGASYATPYPVAAPNTPTVPTGPTFDGAVVPPGPSNTGILPIRVWNTGANTWPANGPIQLTYKIYTYDTASQKCTTTPAAGQVINTAPPTSVAPEGWVTINAQLGAIGPLGTTYCYQFDMIDTSVNPQVLFSQDGVSPSGMAQVQAKGQLPYIQPGSPAPLDYQPVSTLTPTLSVVGIDPNNAPLTYTFQICDTAHPTTCYSSAAQSQASWTPPRLTWDDTWQWTVTLNDGTNSYTPSTWFHVVTYITQTGLHAGSEPSSSPSTGGVNPVGGNFSLSNVDLSAAGVGPAVMVSRSYNTLTTTTGPFGPGWSSAYDMTALADTDGSGNIIVTYTDGRQERYGSNPSGSPTPYGSPAGSSNQLGRNGAGNLVLTRADGSQYGFNAAGQLASITDAAQHTTTLTYSSGQLTTVSGVAGRTLTFTWTNGRVTKVVGPAPSSVTWTYSYDGTGRLQSACNTSAAAPNCTTYTYTTTTPTGLLASVTLPRGNQTVALGYNTDGTVAWRQDGAGNRWNWAYSTNGGNQVATVTDPTGHSASYTYNANRQLIAHGDENGHVTTYSYNVYGFLAVTTDPNGNSVVLGTDTMGNILQRTTTRYAAPGVLEQYASYYTYQAGTNRMLTSSSANSAGPSDTTYQTVYTYGSHASDGLTSKTTPSPDGIAAGDKTQWAWSQGTETAYGGSGTIPKGLLLTKTMPAGGQWHYLYDTIGDLRQVTDPVGQVTVYTYDELGRVASQKVTSNSFPSGLTTSYSYDAYGRVVTQTNPGVANTVTGVTHTEQITNGYDANGNLTSVTNADTTGGDASRTTTYRYDSDDRRTTTTDPAGGITELAYDALGNPIRSIDADGQLTTSTYTPTSKLATTVDNDTAASPNLIPRDLEADEATSTTWAPGGGTTTANSTVAAFAGASSLALTAATAGNLTATTPTTGRGTVTAGNSYTAVGEVRAATTSQPATWVAIQWFDNNGTLLSTSQGASTADTSTGWTRLAVTATAPAGAAKAGVELGVNNAAAGETHFFDATRLAAGAVRDLTTDQRGYDPGGRLTSETDALGRVTATAYTNDDLVATVTLQKYNNGNGNTYDLLLDQRSYSGDGHVAQDDQDNWFYQYNVFENNDGTFNHIQIPLAPSDIGPGGGAWINRGVDYDADGNITSRWSNYWAEDMYQYAGETTSATYDAADRMITSAVSGPAGNLTTYFQRDQRGLITGITDPRGSSAGDPAYTTTYTNDAAGQQTSVALPSVNVEEGGSTPTSVRPTTTYGYDTFGDRTQAKDAKGAITTTSYDLDGRPTQVALPSYTPPGGPTLNPVATTAYDPAGNVTSATDPRGETTGASYDSLGRLLTTTAPQVAGQPAPGVTTYSYDDAGNVLTTVDPTGALTTNTYDQRNQLRTSAVTDRYPSTITATTSYLYDDAGHRISTTTPAGVTTATYDFLRDPPATIVDPNGQTTSFGYDLDHNLVQQTDPLGRITLENRDTAERITSVVNEDATQTPVATTSYGWDNAGNKTSETSPNGATITYSYDGAARLTSQVEPIAAGTSITTTFGYDADGHQTRITDGNGNATVESYNPWGLPTSVVEPPTTAYPGTANGTWTTSYDADGNPVQVAGPGGVTQTNTYDALNRLIGATGTGAEAATTAKTLGYDLDGRLTSAATPTGTETFGYNDRGEILSAAGPAGSASFAYDTAGRMTSRTDAAGTASFTWTPTSQLQTATDPLTGKTATYSYDHAGELTGVNYGTGNDTRALTYDALGHVTSDTLATAGGATMASTSWTYDANGNPLTKTVGPAGVAGAGTDSYTYDQSNRLSSWTSPTGVVSLYQYDGAGNQTRNGLGAATYDQRNELLTQTSGAAATPLFSDDWTNPVNGSPWNSTKWTTTTNDQYHSALTQNNGGALYVTTTGSSVRGTAKMTAATNMEADFTYRFNESSTGSFLRVFLRASGATGANQMPNAYRLEVGSNSTSITLQKFVNSTVTTIGTLSYTSGTAPQRVRFRVQGTTVEAKVWPVGAAEPTTWSLLATDSAVSAAGVVQIAHSYTSGTHTVTVDDLNVFDPTAEDNAISAAAANSATTTWTARGTEATTTPHGGTTQNLTFDAFDRLITDGTASYAYDSLNRIATAAGKTFSYAGTQQQPVTDGVQTFANGPAGQILAVSDGTNKLAALTDPIHGDLTALFNPTSTAMSATQAYSPTGTILATTGTIRADLGYQAQWTDPTTGKIDMQARMYNPSAGTFTSRDSANNPPDPSAALNRYAYANDNPILDSDPTGHNAAATAETFFEGASLAGLCAVFCEPVAIAGGMYGAYKGAQAISSGIDSLTGGGSSTHGHVAQPTIGDQLTNALADIYNIVTSPLAHQLVNGISDAIHQASSSTAKPATTTLPHPAASGGNVDLRRPAQPAKPIQHPSAPAVAKIPTITLPTVPDLSWVNPAIKPTAVPTAVIPNTTIDLVSAAAAAIAAGTVFAVSNEDYAKQAAADPQIATSAQAGHIPADGATAAAEHGDPECPPTGNLQSECVPLQPDGGDSAETRGHSSGRPFNPEAAGGPIQQLTTDGVQISEEGLQTVSDHLERFVPEGGQLEGPEQGMLDRLTSIMSGELEPTEYDLNFYTHELDEASRFAELGYGGTEYLGGEEMYDVWNNVHTAALEDYGLTDADLFHPEFRP